MSNMRNIGIGVNMYAADNNGVLPATTHTTNQDIQAAWIYQLEEFLNNFDETRICPADPNMAERLEQRGTSFVLNGYLTSPPTDPFGNVLGPAFNRLSVITDPTNTPLAFISDNSPPYGPGEDHVHSSQWFSWNNVKRDISPNRFNGSESDDTLGTTNILYVDGSVESHRAGALKTRVANGENIAAPPS